MLEEVHYNHNNSLLRNQEYLDKKKIRKLSRYLPLDQSGRPSTHSIPRLAKNAAYVFLNVGFFYVFLAEYYHLLP